MTININKNNNMKKMNKNNTIKILKKLNKML